MTKTTDNVVGRTLDALKKMVSSRWKTVKVRNVGGVLQFDFPKGTKKAKASTAKRNPDWDRIYRSMERNAKYVVFAKRSYQGAKREQIGTANYIEDARRIARHYQNQAKNSYASDKGGTITIHDNDTGKKAGTYKYTFKSRASNH